MLEKQILGLKADNSHLNIQLEDLIKQKTELESFIAANPNNSDDKNNSDNNLALESPLPIKQKQPITIEPLSQPEQPISTTSLQLEMQSEPEVRILEPEPEPDPEPPKEPEPEITYVKKSIKGTDYYIGSNNIVYNMEYVAVGIKNGKKIKLHN